MKEAFQHPTTQKGYKLMLCSSAFQKSIRLGDEEEAMFWAVEMFDSGFHEYVWKRLKIISSEDIGLAYPALPSIIQALYQSHVEQLKKRDEKNRPERLFLTQAVIMLCRCPKSRLVDWALLYYWGKHSTENRPIPDYAFDKHTSEGRKKGRGVKHFYEEGSRLNNHKEVEGEQRYKELSYEVTRTPQDGRLFPDEEE